LCVATDTNIGYFSVKRFDLTLGLITVLSTNLLPGQLALHSAPIAVYSDDMAGVMETPYHRLT